MMEPLASVKMITYNHAPYISQAIEGVIQQVADFPFELVIGEDCSTDGTREIVYDYQTRYPHIIQLITSDTNVGMAKNSERTGNACRGKYIAFCEGDDYWTDPYKLQKQVDFLEANPDYGLVYTDCDVLHEKSGKYIKNSNKKWKIGAPSGYVFEQLLEFGFISTLTVLFRAELLKDFMKSEDSKLLMKSLIGDYILWLHFAKKTKFKYFNEVSGVYRVREESAFHSRDVLKTIAIFENSYNIRFYYINRYNCSENTKNKVNSDYHSLMLSLYFQATNFRYAKQHFALLKKKSIDNYLHLIGSVNSFTRLMVKAPLLFMKIIRRVKRELE